MKISIGYKSIDYDLLAAPTVFDNETVKEITIWNRQDNFPAASTNTSLNHRDSTTIYQEINYQWNLQSIGFNDDEYVKADKRIWYLRINRLDNNSIGEFVEQEITENGETYTDINYIPFINYLDSFEIQFNNLAFSTLLHPFFDGTTEVIIPIRGVDHELSIITEQKKQLVSQTFSSNSYEENESHSGTKDRWAVVWGCSCDDVDVEEINVTTRPWVPVESCAFILGCHSGLTKLDDWQYYGVYDYGWNVAYCLDADSEADGEHPLETCTIVTDEYFEDMMGFVDNKLGANDELIVFTHSHGIYHKDEHYTVTDEGWHQTWRDRYRDVISCETQYDCASYYDEIGAITADDTYVFLYVKACHSSAADNNVDTGIDTFPSAKENDHLLTWSAKNDAMAHGSGGDYVNFKWYNTSGNYKEMYYLFKLSNEGYNLTTITNTISKDGYLGYFKYADYWSQYQFKLKISFTIENLDLFYLLEDNDYITSTHTNTQIQFTYSSGGTSGTWLTESYFLKFPNATDDFYIEITADWTTGSKAPFWESLLEIGYFDYSTTSFDPYASVGTNDNYSSYYGRFQAMVDDNWNYDTDLDEVASSRTDVKYIISYTSGQFLCRIIQYTTTLYQHSSTPGTFDLMNSIHLLFKHKAGTAASTSTWKITDIYAEINY